MKKKIIIVGAGISGLYLAYLLRDMFDITIVEARNRIGGRIFSIDGHDMGPSWVWSHHKNTLHLIKTLNLQLFAQYTTGDALYDTKDKVERFTPPPTMPSARVKGSLSALIKALYQNLTTTKFLLSTEVRGIKEIGKEIIVQTSSNELKGDFVVLTLPPRLVAGLDFTPKLPQSLYEKMDKTPTWMGHTAKCVIEFTHSFWRTDNLSGFVFSPRGPLSEIHDASAYLKHALFGFISVDIDMDDIKNKVKEQLIRLFDIDALQIVAIHLVNWNNERYTTSKKDKNPLNSHPSYGISTNRYHDKILFSSTEFAFNEGGYIEGALNQAQETAQSLKSLSFSSGGQL